MLGQNDKDLPLVSVIIPCFNHAHFLPDAIESIQKQDYKNVEIIVVDDGSTDETPKVSQKAGVRYIYQENGGLAAARNTGFKVSLGDYIVFLDADDILYQNGISSNLAVLRNESDLAFVSGCHTVTDEQRNILDNSSFKIERDHYTTLLATNYIGMNGAVMYTRWILNEFPFDPRLKACEDYDHYLRIARRYRIKHQTIKIAEYRKHGLNMSSDPILMYDSAITVLNKQRACLANQSEINALEYGLRFWAGKYIPEIVKKYILSSKSVPLQKKIYLVGKYHKELRVRFTTVVKEKIRTIIKVRSS